MKILVLANKLPYPPKDGGSIATLNMLTGLAGSGNQVTCLALNTTKHNFPVKDIPQSLTRTIRFMGIDCDSAIRPLPMLLNLLFSRKPYIAERFNNGEFRQHLANLLDEEQFDIIQLEGPYPGHYMDVIRDKSKAPVSFRAHNVEHLIWTRKATHERFLLKRWYLLNMASRLKQFEMEVVHRCNCLVTISPVDQAWFREHGAGQPAITIPTGLSMEEYPQTPLPEDHSLFFIGALDWLPNQEGLRWFLEHVFDALCEEVPGLRFHVAGRNAPPFFEKFLKNEQIIYHGEVEDAKKFMQSYRVMVAPLFTGSGIRIKILEAMALGRPVVTTPIGIEGIPAENSREIMVSNNPESFKHQVVNLISNKKTAQALVEGGSALVQENFDTFGLSARLSRFLNKQV